MVILNHSLSGLSNVVRIATAKVDQGAASLTRPTDSHPGFLKFLTRFHKKINPQKSSKDFDAQNPEKIINNGATTHRHAPPQIRDDQRLNPSKLCKSGHQFRKQKPPLDPSAHDLQNLKIASPITAVRASTRRHRLATTHGLVLQICANMLRILQN